MELILMRHLMKKAGDCVVQYKGHTHKLLVCNPESGLYLYDDGEEIRQGYTTENQNARYIHPDLRWYVNTGSFVKLYRDDELTNYAEVAEYDPIDLGFAVTRVREGKVVKVDKIIV